MCGSTRTISSIRTSGPPTSRRGGTSSIGTTSPNVSKRQPSCTRRSPDQNRIGFGTTARGRELPRRSLDGERLKVVDRVLPGICLVASPRLLDPNFVRTVVLLCDHNTQGSWGLVVNRRMNLTFGDLLDALPFPAGAVGPVHWGGPCDTARMQVLHRLRRHPGDCLAICRNVDL